MIDKTEAALSALLNKIEPLDRDAMDAAESVSQNSPSLQAHLVSWRNCP